MIWNETSKQFAIVGLLAIIFVSIWIIVILQMSNADKERLSQKIISEKSIVSERLELNKVEHRELPIEREAIHKINLNDFDFDDISTPSGIPIDGILTKLDLH